MTLEIRPARPDDQGPITELMYSSGPDIYDYLYREKAMEFIRYEFAKGTGLCGWRNVTVAVQAGRVVGTGCFYDREGYNKIMGSTGANMVSFFGLFSALPIIWRSRYVSQCMRPPRTGELYLANFGVDPACRSQGIGSAMIRHKIAEARHLGYRIFGLDVAFTNPRGQALYARLGLNITKEKPFTGKDSRFLGCRKMELPLA